MTFTPIPSISEIFASDKANINWQFPSALYTADWFNDMIPEVLFEDDFTFNVIELNVRQAPTDEVVGDSITVQILKNGTSVGSASIQTNENISKAQISSVDVSAGERLRPNITSVGSTFPGIGLSVTIRGEE